MHHSFLKPAISLLLIFICFTSKTAIAQKDTLQGGGDELIVTGQYTPQPLKQSVYKIKTIDANQIKMHAATDVVAVLNNELGLHFSPDNTLGETDIKIMGVGGSRVKVLLDGVPLADRDATKQSLSQIDINSIEKIEIVEGPMSVVYGTDALAGVINIITKKGYKGKNNLSVTAKFQEETIGKTYYPFVDDGIHQESLNVNWNNHQWRVSAYFTRNNFGGFADTAFFPAKVFKPKEQFMSGATLGFKTNSFNVWYRLDYLNEEIFSASPMNINTGLSFRQYYKTNRYTHIAQANWNINSSTKLNTSISYQDYQRNTESYTKNYKYGTTERDDTSEDIANGYWDISKFKTWFLRSTVAWIANPKFSIQPGIEVKYDYTSGNRVEGNPSITDYSFFVSSEIKPSSIINIRPGIRFSKNSVYDAPPVIPSINTKIQLTKNIDARLSYGRGFRAPILRELYFKFDDVNHKVFGNPLLKAETSHSFMASFSYNKSITTNKKFNSTLTGFLNNYTNFIELYQKGISDTFSYFNINKYKTVGVTLENTFTCNNLSASIGVSYIGYYNEYRDNKTITSDDLKYSWSPEITSNILYKIENLKTNIGFYYKFTGKTPTYILDELGGIILSKKQAFHWADLTISKEFLKYITLQGGVKNLFDVTKLNNNVTNPNGIHSSGSSINYSYGRSYFLSVIIQWTKK